MTLQEALEGCSLFTGVGSTIGMRTAITQSEQRIVSNVQSVGEQMRQQMKQQGDMLLQVLVVRLADAVGTCAVWLADTSQLRALIALT